MTVSKFFPLSLERRKEERERSHELHIEFYAEKKVHYEFASDSFRKAANAWLWLPH